MYFNRYIKQFRAKLWPACAIVAFSLAATGSARSQIIPDRTLPVNSTVTPNANTSVITGGTRAGDNLFHSFSSFSIPTDSAAFFNNAADIHNILTRVTGRSISNINGLIKANGTANLFLLNPNGIIFGPNAQLNVGGSFLASTANSVVFSDRTHFSAKNPSTPPLLTVNVPIGLQFSPNPGNIVVKGQGINDTSSADDLQSQINFKQSVLNSPTGLRVQPEKTLALVGGNVTLSGGILKAPSGRIELGSVGSDSFVSLNLTDTGFVLGYDRVTTFGDIQLTGQSTVLASGAGGGDIQILSRRFTVIEDSQIEASTLGSEPGGNLIVRASESVDLSGISLDSNNTPTLGAGTFADGKAGNITIETGQLTLRDGARVLAGTLSQGKGGSVTIETRRLSLSDGSLIAVGSINLDEVAEDLKAGDAGSLTVRAAEDVEVSGNSALFGLTESAGNIGNVKIEARRLIVRDGSQISVNGFNQGNPGSLEITASQIRLSNGSLTAVSETGKGGNITLRSPDIQLRNRSNISAAGSSTGNVTLEGNIAINTQTIALLEASSIVTSAADTRGGSNIQIGSLNSLETAVFKSPDSTISAGGNLSIASRINLKLYDINEINVINVEGLISAGCTAYQGSKFVVTGRGGLPPRPTEALASDAVWVDERSPIIEGVRSEAPGGVNSSSRIAAGAIVEASGWTSGSNGEIVLTANPRAGGTLYQPWLTQPECRKSVK